MSSTIHAHKMLLLHSLNTQVENLRTLYHDTWSDHERNVLNSLRDAIAQLQGGASSEDSSDIEPFISTRNERDALDDMQRCFAAQKVAYLHREGYLHFLPQNRISKIKFTTSRLYGYTMATSWVPLKQQTVYIAQGETIEATFLVE